MVLLLMLLLLTAASCATAYDDKQGRRIHLTEDDPRLVTCRELTEMKVYRDGEVQDFGVLLVRWEANQIIVGARNYLLRLNLSNLDELEKVESFPDELTTSTCLAKGQDKDDCHNFFRALIADDNKVFTCGTNSFAPLCQWRKIEALSEVLQTMSGVGKCPYSPHQNSTLLMTSDQNFYGATVTDFAARDPAIYRMMGSLRHLRTNQYNSRWLNEPDFVSSYEVGPYVYFFLRETAIEFINCGKVIYSRVARICQNDQGGNVLLQDNWTTFSKARLNCSLPGSYPFHFNELQNTFLDIQRGLIYAIFTTSPTGILGSAVCTFNLSALEVAFHGPFKYQQDPNSAWSRFPNKLPHYQCGHNFSRHSSFTETTHGAHVLLETSKFQLMDRSVQPCDIFPSVVVEDERYTHIAKDEVWLQRQNISVVVLFLASLTGYIDKMALLPDNEVERSSCLVERIKIPCSSQQKKIRSMKLLSREKYLLVGTYEGLFKIPVSRCFRFTNKKECHNSQDPYCGWDKTRNICSSIGHENLISCPILQPPDKRHTGNACTWSLWRQCHHVSNSNTSSARTSSDKRCLCRTRDCACLELNRNGRECQGHQVEVTNCTYPAGKRYQATPSSQWLPWTEWTSCAGRCSKGHQTRSRSCYSSRGVCYGNNIDIRECKINSCEASDSKTGWSNWHIVKENKILRIEEKHRCTCRYDPDFMSTSPILETATRTCSNNFQGCSNESYASESALLSWSEWSECSVTCGYGGAQRRQKICLFGNNSCANESHWKHQTFQEIRSCNSPLPCQTSFWSCWSSLSACSVTCGRGVKFRTRLCLDWLKTTDISNLKESQSSESCPGTGRQEIVCESRSCSHYYVNADESLAQAEFFDFNQEFHHLDSNMNFTQTESSIQSYHLIVVGILCFFLGGIVIIVVLSHCKLSFLFGKERLPAPVDGSEKCNTVAAFSTDGVRTVATRYPYFATNGVAPVLDNLSQRDGSNVTNSSKTPLITKRFINTCQR